MTAGGENGGTLENDDPYSTLAMFLRPEGSKMSSKCSQNVEKGTVTKQKIKNDVSRRARGPKKNGPRILSTRNGKNGKSLEVGLNRRRDVRGCWKSPTSTDVCI